MMDESNPVLVSPAFIHDRAGDPQLILLDATIPVIGADVNQAAEKQVIPKAMRFDIDNEFSDPLAPFPHTMLSAAEFSKRVQRLGVNNDSVIVVYDDIGIFSAPRAWWMFKAMGHQQVFILNGGLPAWQLAEHACDNEHWVADRSGNFTATIQADFFCSIEDVKNASTNDCAVVDARNAERFNSRVDEPRPGLRRGNIPHSFNLPFQHLLQDNYYLPVSQLQQQFDTLGIDKNKPILFSCGSGITACIDAVAAKICGYENVRVYDGSWCEWGTLVK